VSTYLPRKMNHPSKYTSFETATGMRAIMTRKPLLYLYVFSIVTSMVIGFHNSPAHAAGTEDIAALQLKQYLPDGYKEWEIWSVERAGNWMYLTLVKIEHSSTGESWISGFHIALAEPIQGTWKIYVENTKEYWAALGRLPRDLRWLAKIETARFSSLKSPQTVYSIPGLPWQLGSSWRYNQGPAEADHRYEFDFGVPTRGVQDNVYAAESGTVVGRNGTCVWIQRSSDGLRLFYQHLEPSDVNNLYIGKPINYGDWLGRTTLSSGCGGYTTGHHVHFSFYSPYTGGVLNPEGFTMNGWLVQGNTLTKNGQTRRANYSDTILHSNASSGGCANYSYNGVVLFEHANCNGRSKPFSTPLFTNLPDFNDLTSSIHVGSGWSVKVYEHNDRGGSSRCITSSMWDLSKDYYTSGNTGLIINDTIS